MSQCLYCLFGRPVTSEVTKVSLLGTQVVMVILDLQVLTLTNWGMNFQRITHS